MSDSKLNKYEKNLLKTLEIQEGFSPEPYKDSKGIWTFAMGYNLRRGLHPKLLRTLLDQNLIQLNITEEGARLILLHDLSNAYQDVMDNYEEWYVKLSEVRKNVILNMIINMGYTRFSKFYKTIQALKDQDFDKAADEMIDSEWHREHKEWGSVRTDYLIHVMRTNEFLTYEKFYNDKKNKQTD